MRPPRIAALALALLSAGPRPLAAQPVPCESRTEGDLSIGESLTRVRRKPRVELLEARTVNVATDERTFTSRVTRKGKLVTELVVVLTTDGSLTFTRRFGRGFKGLREVMVRRVGDAVSLTVDGRPATVDGDALVFEDGGAAALRIRGDTRRLLRKLAKVPRSACLTASSTAPRPLLRAECEACVNECWGVMLACEVAEVAACTISLGVTCGIQAVVKFAKGSISCGDNLRRCVEQGCYAPGNECCRAHCGGVCCGPDQSPAGTVCAGATPDFGGVCCPRGSECGSRCCTGSGVCADPAISLCCDAGETTCGGACCDAGLKCFDQANRFSCCAPDGDACGAFCCHSGERCQSPSFDDPDLAICVECPVGKGGPLCGETCCGAGEVCDALAACCRPDRLCGGQCCQPEYCLNGTTCCAPPNGRVCGGSCCASFSECCNGVCCPEGTVCTGATCCPRNRRCGSSCCPAGYSCADETSGTCVPCEAGEEACERVPGSPLCCPTGVACCTNGACCGAGEDCCARSPTATPSCTPSFNCVR